MVIPSGSIPDGNNDVWTLSVLTENHYPRRLNCLDSFYNAGVNI